MKPEAWQKQAIEFLLWGDALNRGALNHPAAPLCSGAERG
jgi:uncharacterized iron-regulated protein